MVKISNQSHALHSSDLLVQILLELYSTQSNYYNYFKLFTLNTHDSLQGYSVIFDFIYMNYGQNDLSLLLEKDL